MIGRRKYAIEGAIHTLAPGDYGKVASGTWYARAPRSKIEGEEAPLGNLSAHEVLEHEDGTITVSPSILVTTRRDGADVELWHGYLERGIWREV